MAVFETTEPKKPALKEMAFFGFVFLFFLYAFSLTIKPLADPDLWWHLKTGQWMLEKKSLPGHEDPFSYTTPMPLSSGSVAGMRHQWLGQIAFYLVYLASGLGGVTVFRGLLIVAPFVFLFIMFIRRGMSPIAAIAVCSLPVMIPSAILTLPYERPQALSFVLSLAVVFLLEKIRTTEKEKALKSPYAIALLAVMALWGNLHAGYATGDIIIIIYIFGEAIDLLFKGRGGLWGGLNAPSPEGRPATAGFFIVSFASVLASFINPNGMRLFYSYVLSSPLSLLRPAGSVSGRPAFLEYRTLFFHYTEFHHIWAVYAMAFILVAVICLMLALIKGKGMRTSVFLNFLFIAFIGFYFVRATEFALLILTYYIGGFYMLMGRMRRLFTAIAMPMFMAAFLVHTWIVSPVNLKPSVPQSWVDDRYPDDALLFLKKNKIEGPMYNYFVWGGYIIWRAYPDYKVFIDGRSISSPMVITASSIMSGAKGWQGVLDAYNVNIILIPLISQELGLVSGLAIDVAKGEAPEWKLIYLVRNVAIFLKDAGKNRRIIDKGELPNELIYYEGLSIADVFLKAYPGSPNLILSKAVILYNLKRYEEAGRLVSGMKHPLAKEIRKKLSEKGY
jgi:hypothetical protein